MNQTGDSNQQQTAPISRFKSHEQRLAGPPRRPTPLPLLAYIFLVIFTQIVAAVFPGFPPFDLSGGGILFLFLRLLVFFLLVNRSTIGWIVAVLIETLTVIVFSMELAAVGVENAPKLITLLFLTVLALALLLTRQSRQHIWSPVPPVATPEYTDSEQQDESEQRQADSSSSSSSSSG